MMKTIAAAALMTTTLAATGAFAQTPAPNTTAPAAPAVSPAPMTNSTVGAAVMMGNSGWRASKLMGIDIYNLQNEKLGDINEVILDRSGKVAGVVIGVGGFLGMGEHNVLVNFEQLRFVDEPMRTVTTTTAPANSNMGAANPRTDAANAGNATMPTTSTTARSNTTSNYNWYPDHAILSATKDQLKAMQQFNYNK